ncbi:signal recognition particle 19 kDa protein-like protein [Leptotrombidium deliense]|uniref:Signal recognition particle 19 kDa protein-like protein n=1 Tax=Leptotrombidium deliense TaxID=299467 RepID=A0A443S7S5_9ACAR|nr:signal recognition particle 19 kDa protein-like protein [Leptotrombidium deliense]
MEVSKRRVICVYPAYLNANKTKAEGRRLNKEKCIPDPRWQEIRDVLEATKGFEVVAEPNKVYTREVDKETPTFRGRVKVTLPENDAKYKTKDDVIELCADLIPKLKTRGKAVPNNTANTETTVTTKKKKGRK